MSNALPLNGITVIELGDSAAAPFCGQILGDLGADVIKIERPGGDSSRQWSKPTWDGLSPTFAALNRNKRSIVMDITDPDTLDQLRTMVRERADVFLHNLRPGSPAKFGLDGEALLALHPHLVYLAIGAFGNRGPLADRPGYDPLMQAFGGIMSVTGEEGRPPVRVGVSIVDFAAGMWGAIGILAALRARDSSGRGSIVDTSLYETSLSWMTFMSAGHFASGELPARLGSGSNIAAPYRAYEAADGFLVIAAGTDRLFCKLCDALGHPEWSTDARFAANMERVRNRDILDAMVGEVIASASRRDWQERLERVGVPNAPLQNISEVHSHPQTEALGMLLPTAAAGLHLMGLPLSFNGKRPGIRREPPQVGQHTNEVLGNEV